MKRLIAERSVLYLGRMYAPGDALPASDGIMVAAWLRAKSAKWTGERPGGRGENGRVPG